MFLTSATIQELAKSPFGLAGWGFWTLTSSSRNGISLHRLPRHVAGSTRATSSTAAAMKKRLPSALTVAIRTGGAVGLRTAASASPSAT